MSLVGTTPLADGADEESIAEKHHRTLTELHRTVRRHPAVEDAYAAREGAGQFRDLHAEFVPEILGIDADEAGLRIQWRPRRESTERAYFVFHYYDSTGRDFGWHREPNPHVDGPTHFQQRADSESAYTYERAQFEWKSPIELLWDVLGRIEERV